MRRFLALALGLALAAAPALALDLKQGATSYAIVFQMVATSDGSTAVTGITPAVTISKNGGTFASPGGTVAEIGNGWYKLTPSAGDTGTIGTLILHATGTGAYPTDVVTTVVAYDPASATNLGLTNLDATVSSRNTGAVTLAAGQNVATVGGLAPPANWNAMAITAGAVTVGTNNDKTGYSLATAPPTAAAIANTILTDTTSGDQATAGSLGFITKQLAQMVNGTPAFTTAALANAPAGTGGGSVTVAGYAAGQDPASLLLVTPSNKLATDSSGRVTTRSRVVTGTVVAGSTASSVVVSGLPAGANYQFQRLYRDLTGESKVIQSQAYAGGNYTFTLGTTPGTQGPFGSAPSAGETVGVPN